MFYRFSNAVITFETVPFEIFSIWAVLVTLAPAIWADNLGSFEIGMLVMPEQFYFVKPVLSEKKIISKYRQGTLEINDKNKKVTVFDGFTDA